MNKEDVVHIYNGILLSHKKDKIMLFAVIWMQVGIVIFSEIVIQFTIIHNQWEP